MNKIEMIMPKMGESIMEGTILKWLKKEGDYIKEDESVLEVATDKVDTEIPSTCSGKISQLLVKEGDIVNVGAPIALIESDEVNNEVSQENSFADTLENNIENLKEDLKPDPTPTPTPENKIKENLKSNNFFSPLVLNIASRENISISDLEKIIGTGENNRITKYDLLKYLEDKNLEVPTNTQSLPEEIILKEGEEIIETDRVRKIISERMVESKRISAHVTSFVEADITDVFNARKKIKDKFLEKNRFPLSFNPVFISCVSKALQEYPLMNISFKNNKIIKKNYINIGIAVALEDDNLIVPVLKDCDKLSFMEMAEKSNVLINNARNNNLSPDDLDGGTFTISNVGSFGNIMGTPIILQPQVGILAIGSIRKTPSVIETSKGDEIGIRNKLYLSHSYDHRIIDGAIGGKFAQKVAENIENFDLLSDIEL